MLGVQQGDQLLARSVSMLRLEQYRLPYPVFLESMILILFQSSHYLALFLRQTAHHINILSSLYDASPLKRNLLR